MAGLPKEGFVRLKQILCVFPVSESHWLRGVKSGKYPSSIALTSKTVAWRVEDIRKLLESLSKSESDS
ncbi:helix-turn-helix transcriptional regulator [Maridesulfovibrio frigidus]|uniref:helix-turn-helix transcriptional regulator n=1 Tax=Maridesulfovibrio frigidus TaxID=340956 RepID=UPI0004E27C89|nr:AlpA family phage regulatory protein [Maridesulfovibrio frigidus]